MTFDQTTMTVINKEFYCIWPINFLSILKRRNILFHSLQKSIDNVLIRIEINNTEIERVSTFNFLGVIIDEHLIIIYN